MTKKLHLKWITLKYELRYWGIKLENWLIRNACGAFGGGDRYQ